MPDNAVNGFYRPVKPPAYDEARLEIALNAGSSRYVFLFCTIKKLAVSAKLADKDF